MCQITGCSPGSSVHRAWARCTPPNVTNRVKCSTSTCSSSTWRACSVSAQCIAHSRLLSLHSCLLRPHICSHCFLVVHTGGASFTWFACWVSNSVLRRGTSPPLFGFRAWLKFDVEIGMISDQENGNWVSASVRPISTHCHLSIGLQ
jgi:hypothetical protein